MLQAAFDHEESFLILPKPEKLNFNELLRFKFLKTENIQNWRNSGGIPATFRDFEMNNEI